MSIQTLGIERRTLHGPFDRDAEPALTVDSGDTVIFQTLDAGWGKIGRDLGEPVPEIHADEERDKGHALTGPVAVRGAQPGDVLEIGIKSLRTGAWGWTWAGPRPWLTRYDVGLEEEARIAWRLDPDAGTATAMDDRGLVLPLRPFMGVMGNALAETGRHSTTPPRRVGGNMDCRELIAGSTLWLPIEVEGALFSVGDGHGAQGDGEVSSTAIECPMDRVELSFDVRRDMTIDLPCAQTPAGFLTMGFAEGLDDAAGQALDAMVTHMVQTYGFSRAEAMIMASLTVQMRITQVVNQVSGVHALLPPEAFTRR